MTLPPHPHSVSTLQPSRAESLRFSRTREQGRVTGKGGFMDHVVILFPKHSDCASQEGKEHVSEAEGDREDGHPQGLPPPASAPRTAHLAARPFQSHGFAERRSAQLCRDPTSCMGKSNSEKHWEPAAAGRRCLKPAIGPEGALHPSVEDAKASLRPLPLAQEKPVLWVASKAGGKRLVQGARLSRCRLHRPRINDRTPCVNHKELKHNF